MAKERKLSFIETMNSGNSLDGLDTPKETIVKPEEIIEKHEIEEIVEKDDNEEINSIEKPAAKQEQSKKGKTSKNNKEFIENLISDYTDSTEKTKEKSSLHITPELHYKLKMLAFSAKVNLFDLTNAIFHSYLEGNKDNIDALVKKLSI